MSAVLGPLPSGKNVERRTDGPPMHYLAMLGDSVQVVSEELVGSLVMRSAGHYRVAQKFQHMCAILRIAALGHGLQRQYPL